MQHTPPFKRALRNSILIALVVAAVVLYQGDGALNSVITALFTWAVTFPALWLSFNYTQRLLEKHAHPDAGKADKD